ncbi:MAG: hypothetical protein HYX20_02290 [Candidatus Yanofskybacteria bacterium]|nr:hypothetical protein [Candidatus Yanofskybacteria bacterium]
MLNNLAYARLFNNFCAVNFNPEIFRAYDIRGIYGRDFDEDFAFKLGQALVKYINKRIFLIGYGSRQFSEKLAQALVKGITSVGADVEFIGLASTPLFNFALKKLGVNGGVMLTASHLGPQYGGFKVFGEGGVIVGLNSGLEKIKVILTENKNFEVSRYGGKLIKQDRQKLIDSYTDFIIKKSSWNVRDSNAVRVKIEPQATIADELESLVKKTGIISINEQYDLSFGFDEDADRIYIFDSAAKPIHSEYVIGLLVQSGIKFWTKPKVIYDWRFSRGVLEKFKEWGIKAIHSKNGRTFIRENIVKYDADIGGELSGHIYFKETNYNEMPFLVMLRLLKIINKSGKNIRELTEQFRTWFNSGEINIAKHETWNKEQVFVKLKEKYKDGKIDELDGIMVEYPDWWFNFRPSNTEPVLRLVVEAKTKKLLEEKLSEIKGSL